jgi:hypothetical protein
MILSPVLIPYPIAVAVAHLPQATGISYVVREASVFALHAPLLLFLFQDLLGFIFLSTRFPFYCPDCLSTIGTQLPVRSKPATPSDSLLPQANGRDPRESRRAGAKNAGIAADLGRHMAMLSNGIVCLILQHFYPSVGKIETKPALSSSASTIPTHRASSPRGTYFACFTARSPTRHEGKPMDTITTTTALLGRICDDL